MNTKMVTASSKNIINTILENFVFAGNLFNFPPDPPELPDPSEPKLSLKELMHKHYDIYLKENKINLAVASQFFVEDENNEEIKICIEIFYKKKNKFFCKIIKIHEMKSILIPQAIAEIEAKKKIYFDELN